MSQRASETHSKFRPPTAVIDKKEAEGRVVGIGDGLAVGLCVGRCVGFAVGPCVGFAVGPCVKET